MKKNKKKLHKIDFTKGASFLEIGITMFMLLYLLLMVVGIFIKRYTVEQLNLRADEMSRKIIVCTSMDDAEKLAEDNIEIFDLPFVENMKIDIDYVPGGDASWNKGNYINIYYTADVNSVTVLTKTKYNSRIVKMIENN